MSGDTLTGKRAGARVGDVFTTEDGATWQVTTVDGTPWARNVHGEDGGRFVAVPYDPTLPRWARPDADPVADLAAAARDAYAQGAAPLTRVHRGPARGALAVTLAGRRVLLVPREDGPGYTVEAQP